MFRAWGNQAIHIGLGPEDQEPPEDRLSLRDGGDVLETDHTTKPGKAATGNVVHEPRRCLDAHR